MVISLERAYAVLWPLRHRVARTRTYIIGIAFAWIGGLSSAILDTSPIRGSISTGERAFNHNFSVICLTHRDAGRLHESSKALEQPTSSLRRSSQENCRAERQTVENFVCYYWFVVFLLVPNHNNFLQSWHFA